MFDDDALDNLPECACDLAMKLTVSFAKLRIGAFDLTFCDSFASLPEPVSISLRSVVEFGEGKEVLGGILMTGSMAIAW